MSRQRLLNVRMDDLFPQQDPEQCRVCPRDVVDGRWNYCSERCREIAQAVQKMFIWDTVREKILERDDHTCQACGVSYDRWERAHWQIREIIDERTDHYDRQDETEYQQWHNHREDLQAAYDVPHPNGKFEVDHITRIADGGHPFDESNLRTLCEDCHAEKTAEENSGRQRDAQALTLEDYLNA